MVRHPPDRRRADRRDRTADGRGVAVIDELNLLVRGLRLGEGFALYLVALDSRRHFDALVEGLRETEGLCVGLVDVWDVYRKGAEVLGEREQALGCAEGERAVLVVAGIDEFRAHAPDFFRLLNQRRNVMLRATGAAVVMAAEDAAIQALRREAPDTWSVRAADLRFVPPPRAAPVEIEVEEFVGTGVEKRFSRSRLPGGARKLFGRDGAMERLTRSWEDRTLNVVTLVAWGGVGKTALVRQWRSQLRARAEAGELELDALFEWSFYSQGLRDRGSVSADGFIHDALMFFGEKQLAESPQSQESKGARLAEVVGGLRALLILDGLEPLQAPDGSIREPGVARLLEELAERNRGLCVVTTRAWPRELDSFGEDVAPRWNLDALDEDDGAALLEYVLEDGERPRPVSSTIEERREVSRTVQGHALTLQLLGRYVRAALGDLRRWREIDFRRADDAVQGGHAFRVMDAYVRWLEEGGETEARELAVLKLLGLFDRGADPECMAALRAAPAIPGVTEAIVGLDAQDWAQVISGLEERWLVTREEYVPVEVLGFDEATAKATGPDGPLGEPQAWAGTVVLGDVLDAHPLVREYFGRVLRENAPAGFREGHLRLYDHLRTSVPYWPESAEGLGPLYQSIVHGCAAGRFQQVCDDIYQERIIRGPRYYSVKQLGTFGADLAAMAWLFDSLWDRPSGALTPYSQSWALSNSGYYLSALGRLNEALEPANIGLDRIVEDEDWENAARAATNLVEINLLLGQLRAAETLASKALDYGKRCTITRLWVGALTQIVYVHYQLGKFERARTGFYDANIIHRQSEPKHPILYSMAGYHYADFLLHPVERAVWSNQDESVENLLALCSGVTHHTNQSLIWAEEEGWLRDIALDHLTLGRTALYEIHLRSWAETSSGVPPTLDADAARDHLAQAVAGLRKAGHQGHLPPALLTRAWLHHIEGQPDDAKALLARAERIATRGPMPLHLADVHLHRARLFHDREALAKARTLIERHHYGRRLPELEDAERDAETWPDPAPLPPVPQPKPTPPRPDLAILIALPEELQSLAEDYANTWEDRPNPVHPGTDFFFEGPNDYRCVVALMPRMGPTVAAQVAHRLLAHRPATIVNIGIAGGLKSGDLRIGDLIVPRQVDAYDETGKFSGAEARWQRRSSDFRPSSTFLHDVIELSFRQDSKRAYQAWREEGREQLETLRSGEDADRITALLDARLLREAPTISTAHLASGSFVVASKSFARFIREANADIHAVEMEAAGMMAAAEYQRDDIETLVIRGISDHVDADKTTVDAIGDGALRKLAMDNAWRFAKLLMELERLPRAT